MGIPNRERDFTDATIEDILSNLTGPTEESREFRNFWANYGGCFDTVDFSQECAQIDEFISRNRYLMSVVTPAKLKEVSARIHELDEAFGRDIAQTSEELRAYGKKLDALAEAISSKGFPVSFEKSNLEANLLKITLDSNPEKSAFINEIMRQYRFDRITAELLWNTWSELIKQNSDVKSVGADFGKLFISLQGQGYSQADALARLQLIMESRARAFTRARMRAQASVGWTGSEPMPIPPWIVTAKQLDEWVASGEVKTYVSVVSTLDPLAGLNWFYHPQGGGYGDRSMYDLPPGSTGWHAGLDLYTNGTRIGTPLYSAWSGTVIENEQFNNEYRARGNYVLIKLDKTIAGKEIYVLMQHMKNVDITPGQPVSPGDVLGAVGNSGVGSPSGHLHLEIMVGGITTNPDDPNSNEYFSIDPVNDPRAFELLKPYPSAF